jgi:zinc protease
MRRAPHRRPRRVRVLLTLGTLAALPAFAVPAGPAADVARLPAHASYTLGNGLSVTVMPLGGVPLVTLRLELGSGSLDDPPGREGVAALTAHLLTKGTVHRNALEFAEAVEFEGGALAAGADAERTVLEAEFLAEDVALAITLLADAVQGPTFSADEVERARAQTLAEIQGELDDPSALATRRFRDRVFAGHPLGHGPSGTLESVRSLARRDLKEFHDRHYVPTNAHLVVVGRCEREALEPEIERAFGGWHGRALPARDLPAPLPPTGRRVVVVDKPDAAQAQIRLGSLGVPRRHPDYFPLVVGNTVLGGGFTSRLTNEVRVDRGLTYSISSAFVGYRTAGLAQITTFTKSETARETVDLVLSEVRKIRTAPVAAAELATAKSYVKGTFLLSLEAPEDLAQMVADIRFYGLPADYVETYGEKVDAVTEAEVQRALAAHLPDEHLWILLVASAAATRAQLEGLGSVEIVPLE